MSTESGTNRLVDTTSPYLLQHARNPVAWYPWGEAALEKARREDKPILLSIGYSACHWCHVMAHESFEDPPTAQVMNELFVNVKVDREERPDLDKIYQIAHQILTQRPGGWPLTMFLTPDSQVPFFGGTYFPRQPMHGLPAFTELLRHVEQFFRENRQQIEQQNASLLKVLGSLDAGPGHAPAPNEEILGHARREWAEQYDQRHGGFGRAPKFPHATHVECVLRHWAASGGRDTEALAMAGGTLRAMACGGIYDHVGGGFARYAVDDLWMIPHFEKMLYDNAALLSCYSEAWAATGEALYRRVAGETADWVLREMLGPDGGFCSSLDADSEGEEGRFYTWTPDEARQLLTAEEYAAVARHYGLDRGPNFEGRWHLYIADPDAPEHRGAVPEGPAAGHLETARAKLLAARETRVRPGRDDKILTSWNGLMIHGLATAARHLDRPDLAAAADTALDFVRRTLWRDGRLLATYKDGSAHTPAYLDDYAFMILAALSLLQWRWRTDDLTFACSLADVLLDRFQDHDRGGFYFTADDHEALIHRPKGFVDESTPSGNGIAAWCLGRLGHLLGETRYLGAAERTLHGGWASLERMPSAHGSLLQALEEWLHPPQAVILRGPTEAVKPWWIASARPYAPRRFTLAIPGDETDLPGALAQRTPRGPGSGPGRDDVVAYTCTGTQCSAPITDAAALDTALEETAAPTPG